MAQNTFHTFSMGLFLAVYFFYDLFTASIVLASVSFLQLLQIHLRKIPVHSFEKFNLFLISSMGFLSWWFHNAQYIQWKVSLVYFIFAGGVWGYTVFYKSSAFLTLIASQGMSLPKKIARSVDVSMMAFFTAMGLLNILVMQACSLNTWVWFKGSLIFLNILFFGFVSLMVSKHIQLPEAN